MAGIGRLLFLKESIVCVRCIRSDTAELENSAQTPGLQEPRG